MSLVIYLCGVMLAGTILAALYRVATGPTVFDRMLAFDLVATCGVALVALLAILWRTGIYLELILVYTLLGFLGTTAMTLYLQKSIGRAEPPSTSTDTPPAESRMGGHHE